MTDELKNRLDRIGERAGGSNDDDLDRLRAHRTRRERNRALGALVLGVAIAIAGTAWILSTRGGDDVTAVGDPSPSQTTTWQPPEVLTVWPENPVQGPTSEDVQAQVDAGDEELAWRLDPLKVAEHFGRTFMGWDEAIAVPSRDGTAFDVAPCTNSALCYLGMLRVIEVQPVFEGEGGIWSVVSVISVQLQTDIGPMDPSAALSGGTTTTWQVTMPDGVTVNLGLSAKNGCGQAGTFTSSTSEGVNRVQVPDALAPSDMDPSCGSIGAGYAFAYTTSDIEMAVGDPLLEPGNILDVTIVPVYLEMIQTNTVQPTPSETSDVVLIACDGTSTTMQTPTAAAQADGVHLRIDNTSGTNLSFQMDSLGGDNADIGTTDLVAQLAPGTQRVRCQDPFGDRGSAFGWVSLEVVDPNGYWVDPALDCNGGMIGSSNIDYAQQPAGILDPIEAGRNALQHYIQEGDELKLAGYPESKGQRTVVLVRDGRVVASVRLQRGTVGWFNPGISACNNEA